jgi:hypothetical protein
MNDSTRAIRRPRRARPPTARTVVAIIAMAALALLAAACSGSPSSTGSRGAPNAGGSTSAQLLDFARCMRSNGVPNFPDPTSDEKFPGAQQLGVSDSQFHTAYDACKHLLPNGGTGPNQVELQQQVTALLPFARCVRSHEVPNWPDPSIQTNPSGTTAVVFDLIGIQGLDGDGFDSPQVQAGVQQCQNLLPPSNGGPPFLIMRT